MQVSIITPLVAFIALVVHLIFGVELSDGQLTIITDGFVAVSLLVVTIVTLFKSKNNKDK